MNSNGKGVIKVADITLAQLSRGMYRSTATAFKELVSNAFDADATEVHINTNSPEFDYFSCSDNGSGMPIEKFLKHFSDDGIGSSIKRKRNNNFTSKFNRPIIGRLGIGMMATGQLCHSFFIESHYINPDGIGEAYLAEILLEDTTIQNKESQIRNNDLENKEIEVGKWNYKIIDYDESKKGFHIFSDDVRATLRRDLKNAVNDNDLSEFRFNLYELHKYYYDKARKSIRDTKLYFEMIWELSILCPIPYFEDSNNYPLNIKKLTNKFSSKEEIKVIEEFLKSKQAEFKNYNFKLFFDGVELFKLIHLPTENNTSNKVYFINYDEKVFKDRLKFNGYIFSQIPKAITPLELNGIQIRVKGVGIGGYDSTFLKYYKYIETVTNKWVSGEIFVDIGLESALNIDRDSFNEHDEHYKKIQSYVHSILDKVFSDAKSISKQLSDKKKKLKTEELKNNFTEIIKNFTNDKYKLKYVTLDDEKKGVYIDKIRKRIIFNEQYRPIKKKRADEMIRIVDLAYELSKLFSKKENERDLLFNKYLIEIFKKLL